MLGAERGTVGALSALAVLSVSLLSATASAQIAPESEPTSPDAAPETSAPSGLGLNNLLPWERQLPASEIEPVMEGLTLYGCYTDGRENEPEWAELTETGGALYDVLEGKELVGQWWVEDFANAVCYYYPAREPRGPHCFWVVRSRDDLHFYSLGTENLVARTDCQPPDLV